jgi:hypothetical protein
MFNLSNSVQQLQFCYGVRQERKLSNGPASSRFFKKTQQNLLITMVGPFVLRVAMMTA